MRQAVNKHSQSPVLIPESAMFLFRLRDIQMPVGNKKSEEATPFTRK
jgi:hypothetical protein